VNSFEDLLKAGFSEADVKNIEATYDSVHDVDLFPAGMYIFFCYPVPGGAPQFMVYFNQSTPPPGTASVNLDTVNCRFSYRPPRIKYPRNRSIFK